MKTLLVLPIVLPMATAAIMLLAYRHALAQRLMGVVGCIAQVVIALLLLQGIWQHGITAVQMGAWQAPFGITIVADLLSALLVCLSAVIGLATAIYSLTDINRERRTYGFYPLMQILLMGVNGAFLTGDLFNLYVWFEVMLIASFVLLVLGNERAQMEGAIKYMTLNLIASAIFLTAVGILYGSVHALNLADISQKMSAGLMPEPMVSTLAVLFLIAFGIKAAVFPLFFWLPDSYHTPPVTVGALFVGLLTKVGVYSMIRVYMLLFVGVIDYTHTILLVLAALTMTIGVLGAMAQMEFRRVLAFHSISQVGYMIMGLGLLTASSLGACVFFMLHHGLVKTNLFLVSGLVQHKTGTSQLKRLGNLITREPLIAWLFIISAFSLAGIPPLSGFWGKLGLVMAGFKIGQPTAYIVIGVSLAVGLGTLVSMTKIWNEVFWKAVPEEYARTEAQAEGAEPAPLTGLRRLFLFAPVIGLTVFILLMGFYPEPFLRLAQQAGQQLADKSQYIHAVLGEHAHAGAGT